jgi:hypothetical protein
VYLKDALTRSRDPGSDSSMLGIRPADDGAHRYYGVGIEHFAFEVDRREDFDEAQARWLASGATFTSRRRRITTSLATTRSSPSIPMGFESRYSAGPAERVQRSMAAVPRSRSAVRGSYRLSEGTYHAWFDARGCRVALVRPDFYVFGTAVTPEETRELVRRLKAALINQPTREEQLTT